MADYERLLRVAQGSEPADLVIRGANLVNVLTREVYPATVGICEDTIAYVTEPGDNHCSGRQEIQADGTWLTPGLIDSHMHIESTHATPEHFADAVVPRGVTTVAQDPHEMANVLGREGVEYMRCAARGLPLRVLTFVPTCVPAVPGLETSGAAFSAREVEALLDGPDTIGLAEVMDYWGVIRQSPRISEIVRAGRRRGAILTGHIRGLGGRELNTYLAAGIDSDHEHLTPGGILARTRLGMTVEITRENVAEAVESWHQRGSLDNLVWVTDDVPPHELVRKGHLDVAVRRAIALGMAPADALRAATLAPAIRLRRPDLGQIAPGRKADLLVIGDLATFSVHLAIVSGRIVARDGQMLQPSRPGCKPPAAALRSMHLAPPSPDQMAIRGPGPTARARVLTDRGRGLELRELPLTSGAVTWKDQSDLALVTVWHRHGLNQNHSAVLIAGTGLRTGALATTYAHDSHNLVIVGRDSADMALAARALIDSGGGYAAVADGQLLAQVPLPVAGLLAEAPVTELARGFDAFVEAAHALGVTENPIRLLTSLALPVVPSYRPTDLGLVDVERQAIIPAFEFDG